MVQMGGCFSRSPLSNRSRISFALTASYGRLPYVNNSHIVTPTSTKQTNTYLIYKSLLLCAHLSIGYEELVIL